MIESKQPILQVDSLSVKKCDDQTSTTKYIVDNISFSIQLSEFFTILGENGSGKSTLAYSLIKLLKPSAFEISGEIIIKGQRILELSESNLNVIRKNEVSYIFQNPYSSFDPIRRIGNQLFNSKSGFSSEIMSEHFNSLKLNSDNNILKKFPFQLSGGMLQRISAVRAVLSNPKLIIADEPTSALDKPISNLFMEYLLTYMKKSGAAVLFITQDFDLAVKYSSRIGVLKDGVLHSIHNQNQFLKSHNDVYLEKLINSYKYIYRTEK